MQGLKSFNQLAQFQAQPYSVESLFFFAISQEFPAQYNAKTTLYYNVKFLHLRQQNENGCSHWRLKGFN